MGKLKTFDLFALKGKLDDEKYERNLNKPQTLGEKIMKIVVVAIASLMFLSVFSTFNPSQPVMYMLFAVAALAVSFRAYTLFKK